MSKGLSDEIAGSIVAEKERVELAVSIAELSFDQLTENSLLTKIPWIGWIVQAKQLYHTLSDRILFAKIAKFLICFGQATEGQRLDVLDEIRTSPEQTKKIGQDLLLLLDRIDDLHKPELLAKCFSYYLRGYITNYEFQTLGDAISKCHQSDLQGFYPNPLAPWRPVSPNNQRLFACGLTQLKTTARTYTQFQESSGEATIEFEVSTLGNLLRDVISDRLLKWPGAEKRIERNLKLAREDRNHA